VADRGVAEVAAPHGAEQPPDTPAGEAGVTQLLAAWAEGDASALDGLMPLVFDQLREIAASHLRRERVDHTLQPTALVNELYLKLVGKNTVSWQNRAHFFGFAAQAMRRILVDHARRHRARKRGPGITLSLEHAVHLPTQDLDILALDEALSALSELSARQARVVELRFFVGLEIAEIAEVMAISARTVAREWGSAKAWLFRELTRERE
jgi:RNA polymerase sigma factor (TIGR02999 family)